MMERAKGRAAGAGLGMRVAWLVVALGTLALPACASVWWKPGAGAADLAEDRRACREQAASAASGKRAPEFELERCLRQKGWWHSGVRGAAAAAGAGPALQPDVTAPRSSGASAPRSAGGAAEPAAGEAEQSAPRNRGVWWRIGGDLGRLELDREQCRVQSGLPASAAPAPRWGDSPAFDACMRERGWRGS